MEDSFRVRVDKIFGSLSRGGDGGGGVDGDVTPSPVGVSPSLWCLTDEEIEKRQWNRRFDQEEDDDNDDNEPGPSVLQDPLESDLQELSEEDEEEERGEIDEEKKKRCRSDDDDWDVESNIGRDCTLDYEEEEDENDKVAVGIEEQKGDPLFVSDAKFADYGIDDEVITSGELPSSFHTFARDSRADLAAAKLRLKEDDDQFSGNLDSSQLSDTSAATTMETEEAVKKGVLDGDIPKSILKKKVISMESRSQKRVRFLCDNNSSSTSEEQQFSVATDSSSKLPIEKPISDISRNSSGIPDYVRNPTKYTRYDFDSAEDMDDQSNRSALMDLFQYLRKRNADDSSLDDSPADITKPVMFTPKTKPDDASILKRGEKNDLEDDDDDDLRNKGWSVDVTVEGAQECEASAMEEDEPCLQVVQGGGSSSLLKPGRQYRARSATNADDNST